MPWYTFCVSRGINIMYGADKPPLIIITVGSEKENTLKIKNEATQTRETFQLSSLFLTQWWIWRWIWHESMNPFLT